MGGLVTGRLAESAGDVIAGAMPTCGLMEGGVDLNNYQLDGSHAINELLALEQDIPIEGYANLGAPSEPRLRSAARWMQARPQRRVARASRSQRPCSIFRGRTPAMRTSGRSRCMAS